MPNTVDRLAVVRHRHHDDRCGRKKERGTPLSVPSFGDDAFLTGSLSLRDPLSVDMTEQESNQQAHPEHDDEAPQRNGHLGGSADAVHEAKNINDGYPFVVDHDSSSSLVAMTTVRLVDGLGRVGVYTGTVDSVKHLPCLAGVMVYEQDPVVAKFEGSWDNGRWKSGLLVYKSGDVYQGDFDDSGLKTGRGRCTYADDGRTYVGDFARDKQHGKGCLSWLTGQVYEGEFYENSRQGSGVFEAPAEGVKYQGSFYRGVYHGYGIYQSGDQSVYRGNFEDGQPHGHGVMVDRDGNLVHDGEWENGRPRKLGDLSSVPRTPSNHETPSPAKTESNGHGRTTDTQQPSRPSLTVVLDHVWHSSRGRATYRGLWNAGSDCPTGNGTAQYEDGTTYEGLFDAHGNWHGKGRWTSSNGDSYDGAFVSGERHGYGIYTWSDGRQYQGNFEHNLRQGQGVLVYANDDLYEGEFAKGMRHGRGRFVFANGAVYEGEWQAGLYHGHGKLIQNDGRIYEGSFRQGKAHGRGNEIDSNGRTIHEGFWKSGVPCSEEDVDLEPDAEDSHSDSVSADALERAQSQRSSEDEADRLEPVCPPPASAPPVPPPESVPLPLGLVSDESVLLPPAPSEALPMSPPLKAPDAGHRESRKVPNAAPDEEQQTGDYENCKAVVDQPLKDAQGNPGRYTGIVSMHLLDNNDGGSTQTLVLKPHGVGRMVYADGLRIHEGFWRHGNKHGHGRCLFFPQGDWHEGEYADNNRHGPGRYQWKDGRVYEGNYAFDLRDGQGVFKFRSKDVYTGSFVKGKCSGFGRIEFAEGRGYYEGEWLNGKYHGKGTLCQRCDAGDGESGNGDADLVYEGEFAFGKIHGFGKSTSPDGTTQSGYWHQGKFCGSEPHNETMQLPLEESERSDDPTGLACDVGVSNFDERTVALSASNTASGYAV